MPDPLLRADQIAPPGMTPVSFELQAGHCLSLSGPSGCGKTRLLRRLADLDEGTGDIRLNGRKQNDIAAPQWRCNVSLLPAQSPWWLDKVEEHFSSPPTLEQLQALQLPVQCLQQAVAQLSSGERQRLALLRLLQQEPLVLLLDEPTAHLDETNTLAFESHIKAYLQAHSAAAIWISHDAGQRQRVGDQHIVLGAADD